MVKLIGHGVFATVVESELSAVQNSFQELKVAHENTEKEKHDAEQLVASLRRNSAENLANISTLKLDLAKVRGTVPHTAALSNHG
jgi:hypothetical protein